MARKIPIEAWDHIVIRVSDLERSLAFYKKHLDFQEVVDVEIGGEELARILSGIAGKNMDGAKARLVLGMVGGQMVELIQYLGDKPQELDEPGISAFTLRVSDADEAYRACSENDLNPLMEPVEIEGARQFFIRDPDGVNIEFTQPPKEWQ